MTKLRVVAADDEPLSLRRVEAMIEGLDDVEMVATAGDGIAALQLTREHRPDVLILDIEMPGLGGMDVVELLPEEAAPVVIFVTAFQNYASRAFELSAHDYLLKPLRAERLRNALAAARERLATRSMRQRLAELEAVVASLGTAASSPYAREVWIHRRGEVVRLPIDNVDWMEAQGDYTRFHVGEQSYLERELLKDAEARLDPSKFVRIHRSTVVNLDRVDCIRRTVYGASVVVLKTGQQLNVGRVFARRLRDALTTRTARPSAA